MKFNPLSNNPIDKSKRRHGLKMIDRKWKGRLEKGKAMSEALQSRKEGNKIKRVVNKYQD